MILIILAAAWKQVSYNFLFFLAGLQAIPRSLVEPRPSTRRPVQAVPDHHLPPALADHVLPARGQHRLRVFDTFGIVHATTSGGPAQATTILVYKVFNDGFIGLDLGGSAAQSVVLMAVVIALTVVQFRYIERKVAY